MKRIFAWVAALRLPGEGMHPLSNPTHHRITAAALECLPAADRDFFAPEADLLTWTYCGFPDMNWHWYGTFAQDPSIPADRRLPDIRREWEIARYCRWNSLTREGKWYPHWPPDTVEASVEHFGRACRALEEGNYADAVRTLGACVHYAEDTGSPAHAAHEGAPLHLQMERLDSADIQQAITLPDYSPRILGRTPDSVASGLRERSMGLYDFAARAAAPIRKLCREEHQVEAQVLMLPCALGCAQLAADILHTFATLAKRVRPELPPLPLGMNLLLNHDLSVPDDVPEIPRNWYVHWNDLYDREGRAERVPEDGGYALSIAAASGPGIHWRTTWPAAVRVSPGQRLRLSLRYRTEGARGASRPTFRFYTTNTTPAGIAPTGYLPRAAEWTACTLEAEVPAGACWARVSLESAACPGRILFRDLSVERIG